MLGNWLVFWVIPWHVAMSLIGIHDLRGDHFGIVHLLILLELISFI